MTERSDDAVIRFAERLDALRIIPRFLVILYYAFFIKFAYFVTVWFMAFDWTTVQDPTVALAVAGFPVAILGVMTGVLGTLTNNYFRTGRSNGG
jgi:hypothetical protein